MQTAARRRGGGAVSDTTMVATMGGCPAVDSLPGGRSACGPADLQTARVLWAGWGSGTPGVKGWGGVSSASEPSPSRSSQQLALEGGTPEHMDVATSRGALRRRAVVRAT